jgi:hypothetical protein
MNKYQIEIRQEVYERGIEGLFHFTPICNAGSILLHGLAARTVLEERGIHFQPSDNFRLDGRPDALSLSIHSLNWRMFEAKQQTTRSEWVIFKLDPSVLWTHSCLFSWQNAASSDIRRHTGRRDGPWAFRKMFDDRPVSSIDRSSFRAAHRRGDHQPTLNDAEVQVLDPIDPDYILSVVVRTEWAGSQVEQLMKQIDCESEVLISPSDFP